MHIASTNDDSGCITKAEAEKLLDVVCVKYGFCLPPLWRARLQSCPPRSVAKFTDTMFHAEGLDARTADSAMYRAIHEEVHGAFERSAQSADFATHNNSLERSPDG